MTTKRIQILVIEDNRLLRDGLAALLDSQGEFKVVASAEGASAALQRLQEHKPNVVLVDAALGRNRSQRLVESIKEAAPHARIIMMDMQPEEEDVIDFIKRGANGFIAHAPGRQLSTDTGEPHRPSPINAASLAASVERSSGDGSGRVSSENCTMRPGVGSTATTTRSIGAPGGCDSRSSSASVRRARASRIGAGSCSDRA